MTATAAASVGVNTPPRIPPRMMMGAINAHTDDLNSMATLFPENPSEVG